MKRIILFILFIKNINTQAQVGIGTSTPDASAQLEVSSVSKGFLPPRMTFAQRSSITSPSAGLILWCTDCGISGELQVYTGSSWKALSLSNASTPPNPAGSSIVISQIYGGGGNTGAVYNVDYVELFNKSSTSQSLSGVTIQYSSATGTSWNLGVLSATASIPPGGYYLIQLGNPGTAGLTIPTPDATFTNISMASDRGKLALVNATSGLTGACPQSTNILDFVGYGSTTCFEGTVGPTPSGSVLTSLYRNANGCTDTNDNSTDFTAGPPLPRNSSNAVFICQ